MSSSAACTMESGGAHKEGVTSLVRAITLADPAAALEGDKSVAQAFNDRAERSEASTPTHSVFGTERDNLFSSKGRRLAAFLALESTGQAQATTLSQVAAGIAAHPAIERLRITAAKKGDTFGDLLRQAFTEVCNLIRDCLSHEAAEAGAGKDYASKAGFFAANKIYPWADPLEEKRNSPICPHDIKGWCTCPSVLSVDTKRKPQGPSSEMPDHGFAYEDVLSCGLVKPNEGEPNREPVILELRRYVRRLLRAHACMAYCHAFALVGSRLRVYRFDSQSYCVSKSIDVTNPDHLPDLVRFVAFVTDSEQCLAKFDPCHSFWLQRYEDGASGALVLERNAVEWKWETTPQQLVVRDRPFGSRTCCWGGRARPVGDANGEYKDVIVKMSWLASDRLDYEAGILRHLNKQLVLNIPTLLGKLQVPQRIADSHVPSTAVKQTQERKPSEGPFHGAQLATVVMECSIGCIPDSSITPLELLRMYRDAAKVLRSITEAGVVYRDFNTGNILRQPYNSSATEDQLSCLIIDFGNARFIHQPTSAQTIDSLDTDELFVYAQQLLNVGQEDVSFAGQFFCSYLGENLRSQLESLKRTFEWMKKEQEKADRVNEKLTHLESEATRLWIASRLVYQEYLGQLCKEVESLRLGHLSDLQSLWLCFMYTLGYVSPSNIALDLVARQRFGGTLKNDIFRRNLYSRFEVSKMGFDFMVRLELQALCRAIFKVLGSESELAGQERLEKGAPLDVELTAFDMWDEAFRTAEAKLTALQSST